MQDMTNSKLLTDEDLNQDIYNVINDFYVLITNHSSIALDFMLNEKLIIYAAFDIDEYLKNNRVFYYEYDEITFGMQCSDWNKVVAKLSENCKKNELRKEEVEIRGRYHQYKRDSICENVLKKIDNL